MKRKWNGRNICLLLLLIVLVVFSTLPLQNASGESRTYKGRTLSKDNYDRYTLYTSSDDEVEIDFEVTQGVKVDIYILSQQQYNNYRDGKYFTPSFSRENTLGVDDDYTIEDDQNYYLIVDNKDNARSSDAKPQGSMTYNLEYEVDDDPDDFPWFGGMGFMFCCMIFCMVIVCALPCCIRM